jgi:hypothetical protein
MPDNLRAFLVAQLEAIRTALSEYQYAGPSAIEEGATQAAGEWMSHATILVTMEHHETIEDVRSFWGKLWHRVTRVGVTEMAAVATIAGFVFTHGPALLRAVSEFIKVPALEQPFATKFLPPGRPVTFGTYSNSPEDETNGEGKSPEPVEDDLRENYEKPLEQ